MRPGATPSSGDKLVTAPLGNQDFGVGGVALDLLAQPVDVRFKGMGRHTGIVAPDVLQQHIAADDLLAGAEV